MNSGVGERRPGRTIVGRFPQLATIRCVHRVAVSTDRNRVPARGRPRRPPGATTVRGHQKTQLTDGSTSDDLLTVGGHRDIGIDVHGTGEQRGPGLALIGRTPNRARGTEESGRHDDLTIGQEVDGCPLLKPDEAISNQFVPRLEVIRNFEPLGVESRPTTATSPFALVAIVRHRPFTERPRYTSIGDVAEAGWDEPIDRTPNRSDNTRANRPYFFDAMRQRIRKSSISSTRTPPFGDRARSRTA